MKLHNRASILVTLNPNDVCKASVANSGAPLLATDALVTSLEFEVNNMETLWSSIVSNRCFGNIAGSKLDSITSMWELACQEQNPQTEFEIHSEKQIHNNAHQIFNIYIYIYICMAHPN
jgi:hypothetical protein